MSFDGEEEEVQPVTLDNFENHDAPIDSPRSLKALTVCGYIPEDVYVKPLETFLDKKVDDLDLRQNLAQVKFEHIDKKRREKLRIVREAREKIIRKEEAAAASRRPASAPDGVESAAGPKSPIDKVCAVFASIIASRQTMVWATC